MDGGLHQVATGVNMLCHFAVLVLAQPPMAPPGASEECASSLTRMVTTMHQQWLQWQAHNSQCLTRCIPNDGKITPTPGKVCRSQCVDPDDPWELDYKTECSHQQGHADFKDIDLVWGLNYTCTNLAGREVPCIMSTSMINCMPNVCDTNDKELLNVQETASFCPTMQPYNLSSCNVSFT